MKEIDAAQLKQLREREPEVEVINVLEPDAFREARIPGSRNIPVSSTEFVQEVESVLGDRDKDVVVYCASQECDASPRAARKLEEAGFTHVFDFTGGTRAWGEAGFQLTGQSQSGR